LSPIASIHIGPGSVGLFGFSPTVLDCSGPAVDACIVLCERLRVSSSGRMAVLGLSSSAMQALAFVKHESPVFFNNVVPAFSGRLSELEPIASKCSESFRKHLLRHVGAQRFSTESREHHNAVTPSNPSGPDSLSMPSGNSMAT